MPAVLWADGRITSSSTWEGLLEAVRSLPWNMHMDETKFRSVLGRRAHVWSGQIIDPWGPPQHLFGELERTGMLKVVATTQVRELRLVLGEEGHD